jgi:hypothetical protein
MKKKPISEKEKIEKAIRDRSLAFNKNSAEITGDFNIAVAVLQIEKIVGQIIQSEGVLFSIGGQVGHLTVAYKIHNDWIFAQLNTYCKNPDLIEDMALSFPTFTSRPYIILFISKLGEIFARQIDMDVPDSHDEFVKRRIEILNAIVESIRAGGGKLYRNQKNTDTEVGRKGGCLNPTPEKNEK